MNFYNKKFRKIASVIIIVIIVAMILTGVVRICSNHIGAENR